MLVVSLMGLWETTTLDVASEETAYTESGMVVEDDRPCGIRPTGDLYVGEATAPASSRRDLVLSLLSPAAGGRREAMGEPETIRTTSAGRAIDAAVRSVRKMLARRVSDGMVSAESGTLSGVAICLLTVAHTGRREVAAG